MIRLNHHDRDIEDPWLRARLAALPPWDNLAILDVGCVEGWVLDEYPTALGVDARTPPASWAGRVWVGDAAQLPSMTDGFDVVTCVSVLEHVGLGWYGDAAGNADVKAGEVVWQIGRVLRPGGWLFLTVPIDLTMTKDGKPFARPVCVADVHEWLHDAGLTIHEQLIVEGATWTAAPDDDGALRCVMLVTADKLAVG